jgi:hypothetical protein
MDGMSRTAIALLACLLSQAPAPPAAAPVYEAYAIRFGILPAFPVAGLVAGADRGRAIDIPMRV